jgi:hypothetical protein
LNLRIPPWKPVIIIKEEKEKEKANPARNA